VLFTYIHLILLHEFGSSNPTGVYNRDNTLLLPYYIVKDFIGIIFMLFILMFFIFCEPNYLGHTDNYMISNSVITPSHIVPE
jgi:ubiquinol-cytochrome c reductase cytochrome b subunit